MNKYEDPTQRLTSHNWSEEYKDNYEAVFGVKFKLFYSNGDQVTRRFDTKEDALDYIDKAGHRITNYIEL